MKRFLSWIALALAAGMVVLWTFRQGDNADVLTALPSIRRAPDAAPRATITLEKLGSSGQYGLLGCRNDMTLAEPGERPMLSDTVNLYLDEFQTRLMPLLRQRSALADRLVPVLTEGSDNDVERLMSLPARKVPGFDYGVGALLTRSVRAYRQGQLDESRQWAEAAVEANDEVPAAHVWLAILSDQADQPDSGIEALRTAWRLERHDPAVALALGLRLAHDGRANAAAEALGSYLETHGDDEAIQSFRERLAMQGELQATYRRFEKRGLTVIATPAMAAPAVAALQALLDDGLGKAAKIMNRPRRPRLTTVVYTTREELLATTCSTAWTGAVFDGTLRLALSSQERRGGWTQIVRHEAVHAQLHHAAPNAPTWLHEGLAQHVADQRPPALWRSYRRIASSGAFIPIASMAGSFMVIDDNDDALLAYHQSLSMIDLLIEKHGTAVIARMVALLREGTTQEELLLEVTTPPLTGDMVVEHIRRRLENRGQKRGKRPLRPAPTAPGSEGAR